LVTDKKNRNDQEQGTIILTGNFLEKGVIEKKMGFKNLFAKINEEPL
jgi:hypothetical protein